MVGARDVSPVTVRLRRNSVTTFIANRLHRPTVHSGHAGKQWKEHARAPGIGEERQVSSLWELCSKDMQIAEQDPLAVSCTQMQQRNSYAAAAGPVLPVSGQCTFPVTIKQTVDKGVGLLIGVIDATPSDEKNALRRRCWGFGAWNGMLFGFPAGVGRGDAALEIRGGMLGDLRRRHSMNNAVIWVRIDMRSHHIWFKVDDGRWVLGRDGQGNAIPVAGRLRPFVRASCAGDTVALGQIAHVAKPVEEDEALQSPAVADPVLPFATVDSMADEQPASKEARLTKDQLVVALRIQLASARAELAATRNELEKVKVLVAKKSRELERVKEEAARQHAAPETNDKTNEDDASSEEIEEQLPEAVDDIMHYFLRRAHTEIDVKNAARSKRLALRTKSSGSKFALETRLPGQL